MHSEARLVRPLPWDYSLAGALFLAAYSSLLFLLVDWLRGLVGLSLAQRGGLVALSLLAMVYGYRHLRWLEARFGPCLDARAATRWLVGAIIAIPFLALLTYRGVGGARAAAAGAIGVRETWPLAATPIVLKPVAVAANYLADTWLATLVAVLIAGSVLAFFPALLKGGLSRSGWRSHLLATGLALPSMFCSCCASPIASALYRRGAALGPTLAFAVAAPSLNVVTLLLALLLLPPELAAIRVLAGLLIALPLASLAAALGSRWVPAGRGEHQLLPDWETSRWWQKPLALLARAVSQACQLEVAGGGEPPGSPAEAIERQFRLSWAIGRLVLPVLLFGYLAAGTLAVLLPTLSEQGHGAGTVVLAAFLGTLLMIPTAVEIPSALALTQAGFPALAIVLLVTLPPVSLPSLLVIGSSVGSYRSMLVLGGLVCLLGLAAGLLALQS